MGTCTHPRVIAVSKNDKSSNNKKKNDKSSNNKNDKSSNNKKKNDKSSNNRMIRVVTIRR